MIKSIKLNNFELFKSADVNLEKINIVSGVNLDDVQSSSNGSGKTTLAKNAITFALYSDVSGINLKDLVRIGTKETEVTLIINKGTDTYRIVRTIPAGLTIYKNQIEVEGNTATIKQKYLNDVFGDYEFFKKFRLIDSKGINLLDLGITSLRKELMNFCDDLFTGIRQKLLSDKLTRETYGKDKRLYQFSLSEKRLNILEKGTVEIKVKFESLRKEIDSLQTKHSELNGDCLANKKNINNLNENLNNNLIAIKNNEKVISESNQKCTFDADTTEIENEQSTIESLYQSLNEDREKLKGEIEQINMRLYSIKEKINQNTQDTLKIRNEITGLDNIENGTKCSKCGSIVDALHKDKYKEDKYKDLAGLDYEHSESQETLKNETIGLKDKESELRELEKAITDLKRNLDENTKLLKTLNAEKTENAKYQTLIETSTENNSNLNKNNQAIDSKIKELNRSITSLEKEITESSSVLTASNEYLASLQKTLQRTQECLMKLKEAFKFKDYKYTAKDVLQYSESVKTLDSFAGHFINQWLQQLAVIINNLLKNVNMQVEFNAERDFIKIKNGENELKFEQLSSGQKTFLSSIFKIAILLHRGENEGIIICDEGLSAMDEINFLKFVEICKTLPFQFFIIFHGLKTEIEDVNKINIVRQNGESKIK